MMTNTKLRIWLVLLFCSGFNITAEVVAEDENKRLSEGTIVALGCLGGTLFVALVLLLTCFLIRRYRRQQFLKKKKEQEVLQSINKEFSDSLRSSEIFPSIKKRQTFLKQKKKEESLHNTCKEFNGSLPSSENFPSIEMTLLHNGPVPVSGKSEKYTEWLGSQPQPSPLMYTKHTHEVHPSDRHILNQRVFTVPTTAKTVITQRPKYIVRQSRPRSMPPTDIRTNYFTQDRHGYTSAHVLPVRTGAPTTNTYITKRYIAQQPQWHQEFIRSPAPQEVIRNTTVHESVRPSPVQYVETVTRRAPSPVQYVETVTRRAPSPVQTIPRSGVESTYHIKLDPRTMSYSKAKIDGPTSSYIDSITYRDRAFTDPDYVVNNKLSAYRPKVLQGTTYTAPHSDVTRTGWRIVRDSTEEDSYPVSGHWTAQETEVKTRTAEFGERDIQDDDAVFIQVSDDTEPKHTETNHNVQKRTYEEVVIVDYVEDGSKMNESASPKPTSSPRFPERSPIDEVLHGESSGTSSDSESDGGKRRQRNPSSGS